MSGRVVGMRSFGDLENALAIIEYPTSLGLLLFFTTVCGKSLSGV